MLRKIGHYFFERPEEIGLDNYLVLIFCFITGLLGILGTIINLILNLGIYSIISTMIPSLIFTPVYLFSWVKKQYTVSKYIMILSSLVLLNFIWIINFGSSGPIPYLFVLLESFIVIFFRNPWKFILSAVLFINVSVLFFIEYSYPSVIGHYESNSARLLDLYSGLLIFLFLSIILLNIAIKFYKSQQEKAEAADKLKSAFLANMSHEIRTPMNGIIGFAEILKEPGLSGEQQQEYINIIEKSGVRMISIINDIIDISKIEAGLMKTDIRRTNINEQLEYINSFFKPEAEKKGIHLMITKSLPADMAVIRTDTEKLYAILINLVKNAIKYTDKGDIEVGYVVKKIKDTSSLEFFVKDSGIGIAPGKQEAIFERFIQADVSDIHTFRGAGLGLSISKAYVEMLGGNIRVESRQGEGSVFYFTLPYSLAVTKEMIVSELITGPIPQKPGKLKILIVEDDEASEMLLSHELKDLCSELIKAKSGPEAIEACRNNMDIDLVLMDIEIPGMDGYQATMEIRKFNKNVIIIAQTAYALTGDKEKSILAGCNNYISKPIRRFDLKAMIEESFEVKKGTEIVPDNI